MAPTKKQLEIALSKLKTPEKPSVNLEQYAIPSGLAADILNIALVAGDIEGKTVFDLGCGSGRLAIGAALLGAERAVGVDVDDASIKLAKENAEAAGVDVEFVLSDIAEFSGECDTVVQNPPFGMRGTRGADKGFLSKAIECVRRGGRVYSLHRGGYEDEGGNKRTRAFLENFIQLNGGKVLAVKEFKFDVPYMFKFHRKPKVSYNVDLFVVERV
ncbi:MAG: METTL5 family protein [Candidatus Aenigmatarchaeota archaeon]